MSDPKWLLFLVWVLLVQSAAESFVLEGSTTSYAQFKRWYADVTDSLSFEFKTTEPNGLLLYLDDGGLGDFFELKLVDGVIRFRFNLGGGPMLAHVGKSLHDGEWHQVEISRSPADTTVRVDEWASGKAMRGEEKEARFGNFSGNSFVYVGGIPSWYSAKLTQMSLPSALFEPHFKGSVRNVVFSSESGLPRRPQDMVEFKGLRSNELDACAHHDPCAHGGACISTDSGAICDCSATEDYEGDFCDKERSPAEATFRGSEFLALDLRSSSAPLLSSSDEISLEFRSRQPTGLLLYAQGPEGAGLHLGLRDGGLRLELQLGASGVEKLLKPPKVRFDDNRWHRVLLHRKVREITRATSFCHFSITVDGVYTERGSTAGTFSLLSSNVIYVGGTDIALPHHQGARHNNFVGCIKKVSVVADSLRLSVVELGRTGSSLVKQSGDVNFLCQEVEATDPITFTNKESFLALSSWDGARSGSISFEMRTNEANGVLMYNTGETAQGDFFAFEMLDGHVFLLLNLGSGAVKVKATTRRVDDGQWHSVALKRSGKSGRVTVDESAVDFITPGNSHQLDLEGPLYVGGVGTSAHGTHHVPSELWSGALRYGYVGCMRNLAVNGRPVDMAGASQRQDSGSVRPACHAPTPQCDSSPCLNGGVCLEGWNHFTCDCSHTSYAGTVCAKDATTLSFDGAQFVQVGGLAEGGPTQAEDIRLRWKTARPSGLLFATAPLVPEKASSMQAALEAGRFKLMLNLGDGNKIFFVGQGLNDDQWHTMHVTRRGQSIVVRVDSESTSKGTIFHISAASSPSLYRPLPHPPSIGRLLNLPLSAAPSSSLYRAPSSPSIAPPTSLSAASSPPSIGRPSPPSIGRPSPPSIGRPSPPSIGRLPHPPSIGRPLNLPLSAAPHLPLSAAPTILPLSAAPQPPSIGRPPPPLSPPPPPSIGRPLILPLSAAPPPLSRPQSPSAPSYPLGPHNLPLSAASSSSLYRPPPQPPSIGRMAPNPQLRELSGQNVNLDVQTVHIGAMEKATPSTGGSGGSKDVPNFVGHMQHFIFNGQHFFDMALGGQMDNFKVTAKFGKKEDIVHHPVTFKSKSTYLGLSQLKAYSSMNLYFQFKTLEPNGLLLYNGGKGQDFVAVELVDGHLNYVFNLGDGPRKVRSNSRASLNDNQWHSVTIGRPSVRQHTLMVDDMIATVTSPGSNVHLDLDGLLYVGGWPRGLTLPKLVQSKHGFEGCLASLDLNGETVDPVRDAVVPSTLVAPGCAGPVTKCSTTACANRGICVQMWNSYTCDCDMTSFTGPTCSDESISYRFGPRGGLITLSHPSDKRPDTKSDLLALGFVSETDNAVLVRIDSGTSNDYMELEIVDGNVFMVYNMGTEDHPLGEMSVAVNDRHYHVVRFTRSGPNSTIQVDDHNVRTKVPTGRQHSIFNSHSTIQVGGKRVVEGGVIERPFRGVISGLMFGGERVLDLAAEDDPRVRAEGDLELLIAIAPETEESITPTPEEPVEPTEEMVFSGAGSGCYDDEDACDASSNREKLDLITPQFVSPPPHPDDEVDLPLPTSCLDEDDDDCDVGIDVGSGVSEGEAPDNVGPDVFSTSGPPYFPELHHPIIKTSTLKPYLKPTRVPAVVYEVPIPGLSPGSNERPTQRTRSSAADSTALVIGVIAGALIAVVLVALVVYKLRNRTEGSYKVDESKNYQFGAGVAALNGPLNGPLLMMPPPHLNGGLPPKSGAEKTPSKKKKGGKDLKEWYV
ncbi:hypothetical protein JTE90_003646 [Oedothorax gibbosus]|uniref:Neurexin n=1 Tax=Oedothorax gibbosus TaxID=931172 RepID=A0AAV6U6X2_9ARAC|nr:hypothetical protein JTE90_003646 [Oedothorax gibbosus]